MTALVTKLKNCKFKNKSMRLILLFKLNTCCMFYDVFALCFDRLSSPDDTDMSPLDDALAESPEHHRVDNEILCVTVA